MHQSKLLSIYMYTYEPQQFIFPQLRFWYKKKTFCVDTTVFPPPKKKELQIYVYLYI